MTNWRAWPNRFTCPKARPPSAAVRPSLHLAKAVEDGPPRADEQVWLGMKENGSKELEPRYHWVFDG